MKKFIVSLFAMIAAASASAQDWPNYLGPTFDGKSPETGILRAWPEGGPEVLWTSGVGVGYGGPVIMKEKVYILDRDQEKGEEMMRCLDLNSGEELWRSTYSAPGEVMFPGSRSVPVTDGKYVWSCGHNGDLYCFDIKKQAPVWNTNIWTSFGGSNLPIWAISQCPIIYDDLVVVYSGAPEAGLLAYDKVTGELKWKTENLGPETYASPSVIRIDGEEQINIVISSTNPIGHRGAPIQKGRSVSVDPETGKILWSYDNWECHISCAPVTEVGNNRLLIVGGYERGSTMIQVNKTADGGYDVKELFTNVNFGDQTKPAMLIGDHVYAQYGTNSRRDGLVCMDLEGNLKWKTGRAINFDKGSMIYVDGILLATDGATGLYIIDPDPEEYKQLAKVDILGVPDANGGGRFGRGYWAPIALSKGKLLIRNESQMLCVKVTE